MGSEWALYAIHEHPEDEVRTKQLQICTEKLSNMLLVFAFPAVNKLMFVKKRRNPRKSHHTEQYTVEQPSHSSKKSSHPHFL